MTKIIFYRPYYGLYIRCLYLSLILLKIRLWCSVLHVRRTWNIFKLTSNGQNSFDTFAPHRVVHDAQVFPRVFDFCLSDDQRARHLLDSVAQLNRLLLDGPFDELVPPGTRTNLAMLASNFI